MPLQPRQPFPRAPAPSRRKHRREPHSRPLTHRVADAPHALRGRPALVGIDDEGPCVSHPARCPRRPQRPPPANQPKPGAKTLLLGAITQSADRRGTRATGGRWLTTILRVSARRAPPSARLGPHSRHTLAKTVTHVPLAPAPGTPVSDPPPRLCRRRAPKGFMQVTPCPSRHRACAGWLSRPRARCFSEYKQEYEHQPATVKKRHQRHAETVVSRRYLWEKSRLQIR